MVAKSMGNPHHDTNLTKRELITEPSAVPQGYRSIYLSYKPAYMGKSRREEAPEKKDSEKHTDTLFKCITVLYNSLSKDYSFKSNRPERLENVVIMIYKMFIAVDQLEASLPDKNKPMAYNMLTSYDPHLNNTLVRLYLRHVNKQKRALQMPINSDGAVPNNYSLQYSGMVEKVQRLTAFVKRYRQGDIQRLDRYCKYEREVIHNKRELEKLLLETKTTEDPQDVNQGVAIKSKDLNSGFLDDLVEQKHNQLLNLDMHTYKWDQVLASLQAVVELMGDQQGHKSDYEWVYTNMMHQNDVDLNEKIIGSLLRKKTLILLGMKDEFVRAKQRVEKSGCPSDDEITFLVEYSEAATQLGGLNKALLANYIKAMSLGIDAAAAIDSRHIQSIGQVLHQIEDDITGALPITE